MKKLMIALVLSLPMVAAAGSGPSHDHGRFQEHFLEQLDKRLDLTDEQKSQLDTIFTEHRNEMESLRQKTQSKVDAVLTEDQRAHMQELREERREKWKQHMEERKEGHKGKEKGKEKGKDKR